MNNEQLAKDAITAFNENDREKAVKLIHELVNQNAQIGDNWHAIANISSIYGEVNLLRQAADKFVELNPNDPMRQLTRAGMLADLGQLDEALTVLKPLLKANPKDPALNHFYATILAQKGNNETAIKHLRKTLEAWPAAGQTWLMLSSLKKFTKKDKDLQQMESLRTQANSTTPANNAAFLYSLAKALCDVDELDRAFAYYSRAAQITAQENPFNGGAEAGFVGSLIENYDAKAIASFKASTNKSDRPIFIMGTPRSGSTLVEQILASHSQVDDGSELNLFRIASLDIGGHSLDVAKEFYKKAGNKGSAWDKIANNYLHLLDERFGEQPKVGGRIIDKTLNNSRFLGLIRMALPNAPIIWMKRNPADAALSCYRTFFNRGLGWTWSFADIAQYFMLEDALYNHWTKIYPDAILTVPYEQLVSDPKAWIPKILDHCGLEHEQQVYDFHKTKRAVLTSSVGQVRKPINTNAVGSADKFAKYMQDFHATYKS